MKTLKGRGVPARTDLRWSETKARKWYKDRGWLLGCNYAPSTAVNQLEMWEEETFDPATIAMSAKMGKTPSVALNSLTST